MNNKCYCASRTPIGTRLSSRFNGRATIDVFAWSNGRSTLTIDKGVQMWDLLTKIDIEQAKQEMKLRRAEILRRHAEEGQKLDGDRLELETLYRLVDTFVEKYAKPTVVSDAPKPPVVSHAPIVAPVSPKTDAVKPAHEARHHHQHHRDNHRHQGDTVFATFVRAASRH